MNNRQYILFVIVSIFLLVAVFFAWIVTDLGRYDNSLPVENKVYQSQDPVRGASSAELIILEFGDFECPYCRQVWPELVKILAEYEGRVKLVWKDFPSPSHLNARSAAMAARCAQDEGKFWEYHDYLFANQDELGREMYNQIAIMLDLNLAEFNSCLDSQQKIGLVGQGLEEGQRLGVDATPYIFIGNKVYDYAVSYGELKVAVEEGLR